MSPWLITTTGWPGLAVALVARLVTAPLTLALSATGAALLFSLAVIRLFARGRQSGRSAS